MRTAAVWCVGGGGRGERSGVLGSHAAVLQGVGGVGKATSLSWAFPICQALCSFLSIDHVLQFNPNPTALEEGHASLYRRWNKAWEFKCLSKITELVGGNQD